MDAGTIIYFIVALFFVILGFFNKIQKEERAKEQDKRTAGGLPPSASRAPAVEREMREEKLPGGMRQHRPQPLSSVATGGKTFSPSVSTITSSIEGQSSLKGSLYVADSFAEDLPEPLSPFGQTKPVHPLLSGLAAGGTDSSMELRKAVLYAEILNRKY